VLQAMDSNATDFLLVRHGETDWNRTGRLQGQLDPGLNENGWHQARQVRIDAAAHASTAAAYCSAMCSMLHCPLAQALQQWPLLQQEQCNLELNGACPVYICCAACRAFPE
jgi:bisphosphoglycerate-dependent phosphoglycerate mutase